MELFRALLAEELRSVNGSRGASELRYDDAAWLLDRLVDDDNFVDFLTEPAYEFVAALPNPDVIAA